MLLFGQKKLLTGKVTYKINDIDTINKKSRILMQSFTKLLC